MEIDVRLKKEDKKELQEMLQHIYKRLTPYWRIAFGNCLCIFLICFNFFALYAIFAFYTKYKFLTIECLFLLVLIVLTFVFSISTIFFPDKLYAKLSISTSKLKKNDYVKCIFCNDKNIKIVLKNKKGEITELSGEKFEIIPLQYGFIILIYKPFYCNKTKKYIKKYACSPILYKHISEEEKNYLLQLTIKHF